MKVKASKYPKKPDQPFSILKLEHPITHQFSYVHLGRKHLKGGTAKVKPGYLRPDDKKPTFAVKIFHPTMKSAEILAKKEVEGHAVYHENSVYFSRIGKNGKVKWCALEPWCDGEDLSKYFNRVKVDPMLSISERMKLVLQMLMIIQVLHRQKKVHGDLKPQNFIINIDPKTKTATIKLIDKSSIHEEGSSGPEVVFTPSFLPLEFFKKHPQQIKKDLSRSEDIFALGVICSYMFPEYCEVVSPHRDESKNMQPYSLKKQAESKNSTKNNCFQLFQSMLSPSRVNRPNITKCIDLFKQIMNQYILERSQMKKNDNQSSPSSEFIEMDLDDSLVDMSLSFSR